METKIRDEYWDPWKRFLRKVLRNIDYLSYGVSKETLEEIMYLWEQITISEDTQLFKSGSKCKDIYIVSDGQLNIYVNNANKETFLDTLHIGSSIGTYCSLVNEPYSITAKSSTTVKLLKLPIEKLSILRESAEDLDRNMSDYETYIEDNGLPYWDYRIYRHRHLKLKPIEKFRFGIRRIINILKSYKSLDLRDLLESVKEQIHQEKVNKESHRKSVILRSGAVPHEQRAEQIYLSLK